MTTPARIGWIPTAPDPRVASARLRAYVPRDLLTQAGWSAEVLRSAEDPRARELDCVIVGKPYGPSEVQLVADLARRGAKTVVDVCDNYFYEGNADPALVARAARLRTMIDGADAVTVSTPSLRPLVEHDRVVVVADAAEPPQPLPRVSPELRRRARGLLRRPTRLVWFGASGSPNLPDGMIFLSDILADVESALREIDLHLTVVSNSRDAYSSLVGHAAIPSTYVEWDPRSASRALWRADICVLPFRVNEFARHKSNNRARLALQHRLAVVADRLDAYDEFSPFIRFGGWRDHVVEYATDARRRRADAAAGASYVERTYTPERVVAEWTAVLTEVLDF